MKRIAAIGLAFIIMLIPIIGVSCSEEGKEDGLTQEHIAQVISDTTSAAGEAAVYKFDMDMSTTMSLSGGISPGTLSMEMDSTGVIDIANEAMQMFMTMTMDIPELGEEEVELETYIIDEWQYMKASGEGWMKTNVTPEVWETQNQIEQQIELLSSGGVDSIGSEVSGGIDCYKIEITPTDMGLLSEMMLEQYGTEAMPDLEELFSSTSIDYTLWVAKDSYLLIKVAGNISMELSPEDVGASNSDFQKMDMDMVLEVVFYDYNQPVTIELPPGAELAIEVPGF
ncbi:DUF6612 family protein [Chloroflexota bacterium]